MPALISHYLFGEEVLNKSNPIIAAYTPTQEHKDAFLLGCQGPDPLFFSVHSRGASYGRRFASLQHKYHISQQLEAYKEALSYLDEKDKDLGYAYILGWLAHFQLDTIAHPFVYAHQYALIDSCGESISDAHNCVHAIVESDIDSALLKLMRNKEAPSLPPVRVLRASKRSLKVAGLLHAYVAQKVFALPLLKTEFRSAVQDMRIAYSLLESKDGKNALILGKLERLKSKHSILASLSHRWSCDKSYWQLNMDHRPWLDPFKHKERRESFVDLFEEALARYMAASAHFLYERSQSQICKGHNFNGARLSDDEAKVLDLMRDAS